MRSFRFWLGAVLVGLGVLWLLDLFGTLAAGAVISRSWPAALIALGILALISERRLALGPVVLILVGLALLLNGLTTAGMGQLIWPVTILLIGGGYHDKTDSSRTASADAPVLRVVATALFGGVEVKNDPTGASATLSTRSPVGNGEADLR